MIDWHCNLNSSVQCPTGMLELVGKTCNAKSKLILNINLKLQTFWSGFLKPASGPHGNKDGSFHVNSTRGPRLKFLILLIFFLKLDKHVQLWPKSFENDTNINFHKVCCFSVFRSFCQMLLWNTEV